jgi:hypothetical protein
MAKGVDLSFLSAAFVGGILYVILDQLMPSSASIRENNLQPTAVEST